MSQKEKARSFRALHIPGDPVILYNVWDPGSARAVTKAGAAAIATSSYSVAAAQGYDDGQNLALDVVLDVVRRITNATSLPVTVDFEGGYADNLDALKHNVTRLLTSGAIGLNFEDQVLGGEAIYPVDIQARRIAAIRSAAEAADIPAVINARTDLFLKAGDATSHANILNEAVARAEAYAQAGADAFFVPLLSDPVLLEELCARVSLPVNIMVLNTAADLASLARTGVARISFGPATYLAVMESLTNLATSMTS